MGNDAVIVIPVYKDNIVMYEDISLRQCLKVFNERRIVLFGPESLDFGEYCKYSDRLTIELFADSAFRNVDSYSKLLLSPEFYKRFESYEYMLIHQLDAFVFSDELDLWCSKGYDYIGAPWFYKWQKSHLDGDLWAVGNGGLSLRKIAMMGRLLGTKVARFLPFQEIINECLEAKSKFKATMLVDCLAKIMGINNDSETYLRNTWRNEDIVIGIYSKYFNIGFEVAPVEEARRFAFECDPRYLYKLNDNQLPFGCHGWAKYDMEFWRPFIEAEGCKI